MEASPGGKAGYAPVLFYSGFPPGYHNQEAELKARALAEAGHDVVYVTSVGLRNPKLSRWRKPLDVAVRKLSHLRRARTNDPSTPLRSASLIVLPPRQSRIVRRLNVALIEWELRRCIAQWDRAVAWLRFPTPELIEVLPRLRPAAIVYECMDAYHFVPDIQGPWVDVLVDAERALAGQADVVIVPSESLAERFREWGANVRVIPHGVEVDLFPCSEPARRPEDQITVGFVGTLDYKLDVPVLRYIAKQHPDWHLRLIGPVQLGFEPSSVTDLPNVTVEPAVPYEHVGKRIADFDVGIMPYYDHPQYARSHPLKNLEYLAAGKPAVARPTQALEPFAELLYFANTPAEFSQQLERAIEEDSVELARARRAAAERNGWDERTAEIIELLANLTG